MGNTVIARMSFTYGGRNVDAGQVFELAGLPNDERLLLLGYVKTPERRIKDAELKQCGVCGAKFLTDMDRTRHGDMRHPERGDEGEAALLLKGARRHPDLVQA